MKSTKQEKLHQQIASWVVGAIARAGLRQAGPIAEWINECAKNPAIDLRVEVTPRDVSRVLGKLKKKKVLAFKRKTGWELGTVAFDDTVPSTALAAVAPSGALATTVTCKVVTLNNEEDTAIYQVAPLNGPRQRIIIPAVMHVDLHGRPVELRIVETNDVRRKKDPSLVGGIFGDISAIDELMDVEWDTRSELRVEATLSDIAADKDEFERLLEAAVRKRLPGGAEPASERAARESGDAAASNYEGLLG